MTKTVWITGASSGIGREFARRYAAMGCRLILTARRADRLTALAEELNDAHGTVCRILPADLADRANQRLYGVSLENVSSAVLSASLTASARAASSLVIVIS